jgi:hypothetical protein
LTAAWLQQRIEWQHHQISRWNELSIALRTNFLAFAKTIQVIGSINASCGGSPAASVPPIATTLPLALVLLKSG